MKPSVHDGRWLW